MDFKVGDKVIVNNTYYRKDLHGLKGIVVDLINENHVGIKFNESITFGHDCNGNSPIGYGWYVPNEDVLPYDINKRM